MFISTDEIIQTVTMIQQEHLDIRTVTMGISLLSCVRGDIDATCAAVYDNITSCASKLVNVCEQIEVELGIPIVNKRVAVTPVSLIAPADPEGCVKLAVTLEKAAEAVGINFLGGFSALVHKGFTPAERALIISIPEALNATSKVCASVNVATTKAGINMDAVREMGLVIKRAAELSASSGGSNCARLVVLCNAPEDNPFMAGAFHGVGEPDCEINVGVSGPGAVKCAIEHEDGGRIAALDVGQKGGGRLRGYGAIREGGADVFLYLDVPRESRDFFKARMVVERQFSVGGEKNGFRHLEEMAVAVVPVTHAF